MPSEHYYRVGAFEVVLTESGDKEVHPFADSRCECEDYHQREGDIYCNTPEERRCRHIREAIMYHHFSNRVEAVKDRQESLEAFAGADYR